MDCQEHKKWIKVEDLYNVLALMPLYKNILFSDGKTKLIDCISNMENPKTMARFILIMTDVNTVFPRNSPLWPGCTPLHLAVMFCENIKNEIKAANLIHQFLSQGASVQVQNHRGATPLHLAFHLELNFIVAMFLRKLEKAEQEIVNLLDNENLSHLHIFCTAEDHRISLARKLLLSTQNIESTVNVAYNGRALNNVKPGWTPLHVAVDRLQLSFVELLLKRGANVACKDSRGHTVVHQLFGANMETNSLVPNVRKPLAELLFAAEQWNESLAEGNGLTRLHVAVWFKDVKAVERLLDLGANIDAAVDELENRDLGNLVGCTPLHVAVMKNHYKIVEVLLQRGADVFARNRDGSSLLSKALTGWGPIADAFVRLIGSDDELQKRMEKELGLTMLHVASYYREVELVEAALRKGADPNAKLPEHSVLWPGYTPLLISCGECYFSEKTIEVFRVLVQKGCDIDRQDSNGKTAFHLALSRSSPHDAHIATIEFLSAGADITIADRNGKSAVLYALQHYSGCSSYFNNITNSIVSNLILYIYKMKFVGLDVNECDETLATTALLKHNVTPDFPRERQSAFYDELQATEKVKVGQRGLSLRSFLYETHAISMYPSLTPTDRDELAAYFQSFDYKSFPELSSLLKLQFRKTVARLSLIDPARDALKTFISSNFPDLCVDIILKYLSNSQLKQLIAASADGTDL